VNTIYTDTTNSTPPFEIGKSHHITNAILWVLSYINSPRSGEV
jgi:hypothetical protein